jgi:hypothetical protein
MMLYHLCIQSYGQVGLDREVMGDLVRTIEVADPPMEWGWDRGGDEWVLTQKPAYHESYAKAREQVDDSSYEHVRGAGWFA